LKNGKIAEMHYSGKGTDLSLGGRSLGRVEGIARIVTDETGQPLYALGVDSAPQLDMLRFAGLARKRFMLKPNARENLG
jgi:hypothetical protein